MFDSLVVQRPVAKADAIEVERMLQRVVRRHRFSGAGSVR